MQLRDQYFRHQPAIAAVYAFKQKLHRLLMFKHRQSRQCKRLIPIFLSYIQQLKESSFTFLNSLGKTLWLWRDEIVRMWRFTKNNGITEGFHRKMKLIQRRAYGFRNFDNYELELKYSVVVKMRPLIWGRPRLFFGPGEIRTRDQRIKSPLLYRLSYRPNERRYDTFQIPVLQTLCFNS